jgi:hypothetical protein
MIAEYKGELSWKLTSEKITEFLCTSLALIVFNLIFDVLVFKIGLILITLLLFFFWDMRSIFYYFYLPSGIFEVFSVFSLWLVFFICFYDFFLVIFCFYYFYTSTFFFSNVDLVFSNACPGYFNFYFSDLLVGLLEYLCLISAFSFYLLNPGLKLFLTGLTPFNPPTEADLLILTY